MNKKNIYCYIIFAALFLISFNSRLFSAPTVTGLKCENLIHPNAIDNTTPHFSWKVLNEADKMQQQFYEIQVASDSLALTAGTADLWNTGKFASSSSVMVPYAGKALTSRSLCFWRVRVWNEKEEVSAWSDIARFGVGILNKNEWTGKYIGLPAGAGNTETPLLRKKFMVDGISTAFLHVNSLGYHEVYLNGIRVSDAVLSPAISQLNKRSLTVTYDVTSYLRTGENELVFWLGTGWYKNTAYDVSPIYPTPVGAKVLSELDQMKNGGWETVVTTDSTWDGRETGYKDTGSWNVLNFAGERVDAKLNPTDFSSETLNALSWVPVIEMDIPNIILSPQMTEPDKIQETILPRTLTKLSSYVWLVDMGKSVTGWFELKLPKLFANQSIVMEYSDYLDNQGAFVDQGQKDTYISSGKVNEVFCNKFNYHAFRYVKITMKAEPKLEDMKAYLIHTDYLQAATFECSDSDLNAIHDMIQYTMRCLTYSGYMVDCPHLERTGYGGDGNSSTMTLQTMYDVSPLFSNWLTAWGDVMREGGSLPYVAPNPGGGGGGPYWSGFIIMAPWRTYVNYNDDRLIKKYYPAMKSWLEYVAQYTVNGLLQDWPNTGYRMWFLGDWLAPAGGGSTDDLVNNCFISECFATMEKIAGVLNLPGDAEIFRQRKVALNQLLHANFYSRVYKSYGNSSQLDLSYPMLVGATPPNLYDGVKSRLLDVTARSNNGHIGVGLVGVPILTEWAIQNRAADFMYTMLKKRTYPGYLYMIDNGATTTWESWNGDRSHIHNCYNGIGTWFYQAVGGIRPDENNPGYKHMYIDPQIPTGLTWAKTTKESPYGTIAVDWQLDVSRKLNLNISLPVGTSATVAIPEGAKSCLLNGETISVETDKTIEIENGKNTLVFFFDTTDISPVNKNTITVHPNPFDDYIVLNADTESQVAVYDLSGCRVWNQKTSAGQNRIDTSALSQGVYILKCNNEVVKIVK